MSHSRAKLGYLFRPAYWMRRLKDEDGHPVRDAETGEFVMTPAWSDCTAQIVDPEGVPVSHKQLDRKRHTCLRCGTPLWTAEARPVTIGPSGTATLSIATTDDATDQADGSVTVALSPGAEYAVSATQGAATVAVADDDPQSVCVSQVLLDTVRSYYDASKDNPPGYGENWERVLIAFGDVQDLDLTP